MMTFLLALLVVGVIAGTLARLILPTQDAATLGNTIVLGVIGSFLGGFAGALVHGGALAAGPFPLVGAAIGAFVALLIYRSTGKPTTR